MIPVIYTDTFGSIQGHMINHPKEDGRSYFIMDLDGILFQGWSFDDFEVLHPEKYTAQQLERFAFNRFNPHPSQAFYQELCNCHLEFEFPCLLIDKVSKKELSKSLRVQLQLGMPAANGGIDYEMADFSISFGTEIFTGEGDAFEMGLDAIRDQFSDRYQFKNCYGCQYADYSPYGAGFYGEMICFKNQKKAYLKLHEDFDKIAYFDLIDHGSGTVQETYCCSEFEARTPNIGYRG